MVARTLDSSNHGLVWDKFQIYQGHKRYSHFIQIGRLPPDRPVQISRDPNPLKQALQYLELIETGRVDSQTDLAQRAGVSRSTVAAYLRLLSLDLEIQSELLSLDGSDDRLQGLTEARLRPLLSFKDPEDQREQFRALLSLSAPLNAGF